MLCSMLLRQWELCLPLGPRRLVDYEAVEIECGGGEGYSDAETAVLISTRIPRSSPCVEDETVAAVVASMSDAASKGDEGQLCWLMGLARSEKLLARALRARDTSGWTVLHSAVHGSSSGHTRAVIRLCEAHADVSVADRCGWTPVHIAVLFAEHEAVSALLQVSAAGDALIIDLPHLHRGTLQRIQDCFELQRLADQGSPQPDFVPEWATSALKEQLNTEIAADTADLALRMKQAGMPELALLRSAFHVGVTPLQPTPGRLLLEQARLQQACYIAEKLARRIAENSMRKALAHVLEELEIHEKPGDTCKYSSCLESLEEAAQSASADVDSVVSIVGHQVCDLLGKLLNSKLPTSERGPIKDQIRNLATSLAQRQGYTSKVLPANVEELYCYASSIPLSEVPSSAPL